MKVKQVLMVVTAVMVYLSFSFTNKHISFSPYQETGPQIKQKAFKVLDENCNECHAKKKPTYYFTLKNMEGFAADINTQVFIKEKMPKGRKNVLLEKDKETLKTWLELVFAKMRG